ncbi:MAG: hypothetical protein MZV63_28870 [Marinilabiliales bacterium]|nr:hypothetical protein [Marinilabiliales bacterium]
MADSAEDEKIGARAGHVDPQYGPHDQVGRRWHAARARCQRPLGIASAIVQRPGGRVVGLSHRAWRVSRAGLVICHC